MCCSEDCIYRFTDSDCGVSTTYDPGDENLFNEMMYRRYLPYNGMDKPFPNEWYKGNGGFRYDFGLHCMVKCSIGLPYGGIRAYDYDSVEIFTNVLI